MGSDDSSNDSSPPPEPPSDPKDQFVTQFSRSPAPEEVGSESGHNSASEHEQGYDTGETKQVIRCRDGGSKIALPAEVILLGQSPPVPAEGVQRYLRVAIRSGAIIDEWVVETVTATEGEAVTTDSVREHIPAQNRAEAFKCAGKVAATDNLPLLRHPVDTREGTV